MKETESKWDETKANDKINAVASCRNQKRQKEERKENNDKGKWEMGNEK